MNDINLSQATEMVMALMAVVRELEEKMKYRAGAMQDGGQDPEDFQELLSQLEQLQKTIEEFMERAFSQEFIISGLPVQILDFSSEWERFK